MDESALKSLIKTLEMQRAGLDNWLSFWTWLVVIGVVLEVVFVIRTYRSELSDWARGIVHPPDRPSRLWLVLELAGILLVALGVAGELVIDAKIGNVETQIRNANDARAIFLESEAGDAATSAHSASLDAQAARTNSDAANTAAGKAQQKASNAFTVARGARMEADLFKQDLANEQAELDRIRTPRSLIDTDKLTAALRPFGGTTYTLFTFPDGESIHLTEAIGNILKDADWIRQQPTQQMLNMSYISLFNPNELVPECVSTGIQVHVWTTVPLGILNRTPEWDRPQSVRAAARLLDALPPSIVPTDERNVAKPVVPIDNDAAFYTVRGYAPVIVCVGKKP